MKLNDLFYTIQGEGFNAGRAAVFIRMPFCNLSCDWCDTEFDSFKEYTDDEINQFLEKYRFCKLAVITGGEPSINKETPKIIEKLKEKNYIIAMESNGQFKIQDDIDFLTISPKRWMNKNKEISEKEPFWFDPRNAPNEIKLVIDNDEVFHVADKIYEKFLKQEFDCRKRISFFLSPEWNIKDKFFDKVVDYVKQKPQWRISLQTHKIMGLK